jgi:phosphatidylserine/phosphatidylglycerophosphate/cardiolipin synthase-like enzyme
LTGGTPSVTVAGVEPLDVSFGLAARTTLCDAFSQARQSIVAEFHHLDDACVIESLNAAASRADHPVSVEVHVEKFPSRYRHDQTAQRHDERALATLRKQLDPHVRLIADDDPDVLMHAKAAVVDGQTAFVATANATTTGFGDAGDVLVTTHDPSDIAAVEASVHGRVVSGDNVVTGPDASLRSRLRELLTAPGDLCVATEDLSDPEVVQTLTRRSAQGNHDRILLESAHASRTQRLAERQLRSAGVDVRSLDTGYMHEKYIDAGDRIYLGSANLTHNGIDEAREVGVIAQTGAFGAGADALRRAFDAMWSGAHQVVA